MSKSRLFSGKIKKVIGANLDPNRDKYLDVSNAEPDLGIASADNFLLSGNADGTRTWINPANVTVGYSTNSINNIITVPGDISITVITSGTTATITFNTATLVKTATTLVNNANVQLGNVTITGQAVFNNTTTYVSSTNTVYTDNMIEVHSSGTAIVNKWNFDDGKDIGFRFHYYTAGTDTNAALILANDSKYLEFYNSGSENINGSFVSATYGTFKTGSIKLVNTTGTNSTTTGALTIVGGLGVGGGGYFGGVITATNFIGNITPNNTSTLQVGYATTAANVAGGYVRSIAAGTDTSVSSTTGNVTVWDVSTFQSVTNRGNSTTNQIIINNTRSTNSTATGALIVNGGIGVNGGGYFSGIVTATNISIGGARFDFTSLFNGFNSTDDVNVYGGNLNVTSVTTTTIQATAVFTGYLASVTIGGGEGGVTYQNAMNVTAVSSGTILINMSVTGTYITSVGGNSIRRQLNGTTGGVGWYQLNNTTGYTNNSPSPSFTITGRLNTGSAYTYGGTITSVSFVGTAITNAVSTTTGALILNGGAGIGRDLWVGGIMTATAVYDAGSRVLTSVNVVAGAGISITAVDNLAPVTSFTINNTGVTSLTAGSNITLSASTGSVTVSFNNTSGYITTASVNALIANSLTNYATTTYVNSRGYITSSSLSVSTAASGTSALTYTTSTGVFTFTPPNLSTYATQSYVTSQGYTTTATVNTLISNSLTGYLTTVTPVAGTGISITAVDNLAPVTSFTINNTGVTSLTAGSNITLSASTGAVIISASTTLFLTSSTFNTATVFTSSTQATSTLTGALQVRGGLGVGGNIYASAVYDNGARAWTTATLTNNNQLTNGAAYITSSSLSVSIASSGTSTLTYSTSTGVFTFTPPNLSTYATQSYVTSQGYTTTASVNTLIANSLTGYLTAVTPVAGSGISISNVDNTAPSTSFTINNTGVTSVAAGSGITVSTSTGSVTISATVTGITQTINTWTPTLVFSTTQGTQTYTTRSGNYIKHGNLVQAFFSITISSIGTGAGNFSLGGLPFVSTNTSGIVGSLSIDTMPTFNTEGILKGSVTSNTSTVAVFGWFETSPSSSPLTYRAVTAADLGGTASITGSITYISA